jgi:D-threo-aldose 1-dehydrogenase
VPRVNERRTSLNQKFSLPALGVGVSAFGGLYKPSSDEDAQDLIDWAFEYGIDYVDVAPWYGFGLAEERLGRSLKGRDRSSYTLSTKVGRLLRADTPVHPSQLDRNGELFFKTTSKLNVVYDYSYDGFMRSIEDSLRRLDLDRIDIVYIHDPDVVGATAKEVMDGGYRALHELRDQGAIRAFGVGMNRSEQMHEFALAGDFDVFLLAGRYTLLEQRALDKLLPACLERSISVAIGGVYNSGILANPRAGMFDYAPADPAIIERARAIESVCSSFGVPLKAAAIQFPAAHPAVVNTLVGTGNAARLEENIRLFEHPIPSECWAALKAKGFIREDAPVPPERTPA